MLAGPVLISANRDIVHSQAATCLPCHRTIGDKCCVKRANRGFFPFSPGSGVVPDTGTECEPLSGQKIDLECLDNKCNFMAFETKIHKKYVLYVDTFLYDLVGNDFLIMFMFHAS